MKFIAFHQFYEFTSSAHHNIKKPCKTTSWVACILLINDDIIDE